MKLPKLPWWEWLLFTTILVVGAFLRLYHIDQTLMFQGDQGRDAIIAKRILKNHDIALIGPTTSVGNMYLGPFYYYFMVPWLALTYPNPIGPAIGIAIANIVSIILVIIIGKTFFDRNTAYIAGFLYAIFPVAINYSRFSWNPNLAPLVAILLFGALAKWYQQKTWLWAGVSAICFSVIIQLHYVALTTAPLILIVLLCLGLQKKLSWRQILFQSLVIVYIVVISQSPLVVFDFRHQHLIFQTFLNFFTSPEQHLEPLAKIATIIQNVDGRFYRLMSQLLVGGNQPVRDRIIAYGIFCLTLIAIYLKRKAHRRLMPGLLVVSWIVLAAVGTAFYSRSLYDHYLSYCFPILALLWGMTFSELLKLEMFGFIFVAPILWLGLIFGKQLYDYTWTGTGTFRQRETAKLIYPESTGKYNLVLLSDTKDYKGLNYRYFLEVTNNPPESEENYSNLSQLIIVNDEKVLDPLNVPIYEIQGTGLTRLTKVIISKDLPNIMIYEK